MSHLEQVPLWAAVVVALLVIGGSSLTLIGSLGLVTIQSFYDRIHAPTLGTTWGTGGVVLASATLFSVLGPRIVVHELLIGLFVLLTTPVTLTLLARAALHRDRLERNPDLPPHALDPEHGDDRP